VWRWDQGEPFGNNPPDENPSGLGAFEFPLRLPGQYFDKETNLHYNYFRDFDPNIGRYAESDPIGLQGGLNTYLYVTSNPLASFDPFGLSKIPGWPQGLPEPPLSDDKMRPLTKEQLDQLYKELRKRNMGPEANKVKRYQKVRLIRGSSLKRGIGIMCIPGILDEYCRLNPGDPACLVWDPPDPPDPNDPCKGDPNCI
jgi:RHS repeat-associated protein